MDMFVALFALRYAGNPPVGPPTPSTFAIPVFDEAFERVDAGAVQRTVVGHGVHVWVVAAILHKNLDLVAWPKVAQVIGDEPSGIGGGAQQAVLGAVNTGRSSKPATSFLNKHPYKCSGPHSLVTLRKKTPCTPLV